MTLEDLRRIHSNAQGCVVKRTAGGACDWLYVLDALDREFFMRECRAGRRSVNLQNAHQLGAVAESG